MKVLSNERESEGLSDILRKFILLPGGITEKIANVEPDLPISLQFQLPIEKDWQAGRRSLSCSIELEVQNCRTIDRCRVITD
jgi:hypothetical protein